MQTGGVDPREFKNEGAGHGKIEPDSSGEMADGDPVTATSPVKNGNRCQFLFEYTPLSTPSRTDRIASSSSDATPPQSRSHPRMT
jgi:hypothetical protein